VTIEVEITRLGSQGDGIAETPQGMRYIPFALPGERVRVTGDGPCELLSPPSPDRATPVCRHFGVCGGCVAQHIREPLYAEWKRAIVIEALRQRGLAPTVAPLAVVEAHTRRRAVLTARRQTDGSLVLGYHLRKSTALVTLEECPVLLPAIAGKLAALKAIVSAIPARENRLTVLATRAGLDVSAEHSGGGLSAAAMSAIALVARGNKIARVTINGETVVETTAPTLVFAGIETAPPPGAFVQAVEAAERGMTAIVTEAIAGCARVADLFSGVGTFALPLARHARVLAVDSDAEALAALDRAARHARGLKPVETKLRDLLRTPLAPKELEGFDAVVFDPPRAGAKAQAERLAQSDVPLLVAVSCDPGTLARDLRILVDGGYDLESVTPIDQFLYSAHVEAVAVLRRTAPKIKSRSPSARRKLRPA
jgi:23S rRNA (uracil1939-C5)-methyltransferase